MQKRIDILNYDVQLFEKIVKESKELYIKDLPVKTDN